MEGCGYRDLYDQFQALGVEIVGVGFSSPQSTASWVAEEGFPFEVWTDDDKTLALTYGAVSSASASIPSRITVLLDAEGELVLEYTDSINVGTHPFEVLEDCEALFGSQ